MAAGAAADDDDDVTVVCLLPFDNLPRKAELRLPPLAKERSMDAILLLGVGTYDETNDPSMRKMMMSVVHKRTNRMIMMVGNAAGGVKFRGNNAYLCDCKPLDRVIVIDYYYDFLWLWL